MNDLRFALRSLGKSPGFTVIAVLSLALGIGAATAVFSIANAILLRSLPVPNPQELRVLRWSGTRPHIPSLNGGDTSFAPPHFRALREQGSALAEIFGFVPIESVIVRTKAGSIGARGAMVSDNFFSGLQVQPLVGRTFVSEDFVGAGACVVISYDLWDKRYSLDPSVPGQTISLNGTPFTIVGVLPRGFAGVRSGRPADVYVPMADRSPFLYREVTSSFHWYVRVLARLKPGVDETQLASELQVTWSRIGDEFMQQPRIRLDRGAGGEGTDRQTYLRPLRLLFGVVAAILAIACANLAGLSLARGAARQHELAIRAALGSGRWRLIRQSLVESVMLALAGGAAGLLLATWLRGGIGRWLSGSGDTLGYEFSFDWRVVGFAMALTLLSAALAGLLPAWRAGRADAVDGLRSRGALGAPRLGVVRALVAVQIAVSLLLLAAAGLYGRTLVNLARVDAGFSTEKLLLFQVNVSGSSYAGVQRAEYFSRVQDTLTGIPGVRAASLIEFPLLGGGASSGGFNSFSRRPAVAGSSMDTRRLTVGEMFFATFGVPVVRGRGLTVEDREGTTRVVVVNEEFVRKYLAKENPLGLTIPMWEADWEIVGVCRDIGYGNLREKAKPTAYFPFRQRLYGRFRVSHLGAPFFAVRTSLPPESVVPAVRRALESIDPGVVLSGFTTQDDVRAQSTGQERLFATLCGGLAGVAVLLACLGLYGLIAYNVARRTREIGLRMALGAQRRDIARPILGEALLLAAAGTAAGVLAVPSLTRLVEAQLFGVSPIDPPTLLSGALLLVLVALFAAWLPTRRAVRVNPVDALRAE